MKHTKGSDDKPNEDKLTNKQMKDNVLTLLVAGHDTTTAALTWLIKFLGENSDVLEQLRVSSAFADRRFKFLFPHLNDQKVVL